MFFPARYVFPARPLPKNGKESISGLGSLWYGLPSLIYVLIFSTGPNLTAGTCTPLFFPHHLAYTPANNPQQSLSDLISCCKQSLKYARISDEKHENRGKINSIQALRQEKDSQTKSARLAVTNSRCSMHWKYLRQKIHETEKELTRRKHTSN